MNAHLALSIQHPKSRHSAVQHPKSRIESAFTLSELLVVIVIIVLLLGLAVPAFNLMRGSRSVDSAENQISAILGRARADAIGLQKPYGIMFFTDPASSSSSDPRDGRVAIAEVYASDFPNAGAPNRDVYLDLVPDSEFVLLPPGVTVFALSDGGNPQTRDRYLGFNQTIGASVSAKPLGGVILFGADGQLISRTYGYRTQIGTPLANSTMGNFLGQSGANGFLAAGQANYAPPGNAPTTTLGIVLVDREAYKNNASSVGGGVDDDPLFQGGTVTAATNEFGEEQWIDTNGTPLIINRYNGTLTRGE